MDKVVLSSSMAASVSKCTTQAVMRTLRLSPPSNESDAPAEAGKAAHKAFELWLAGGKPDDCLEAFRTAYKPFSDRFVASDDRLYLGNLERIMEVFFAQCPLNSMPFVVEEAWIERQIQAEIEPGIIVTDKSDGVVRMKDTGLKLSFELKTTSRIDDSWLNKYALDGQITCHTAILRANGYDVGGVLLFGLQFNKLPLPIERKCREHKLPQRDCWASHVRWEKFIFQRSPDDIEDWKATMAIKALDYRTALRDIERLNRDFVRAEIPQEGLLNGECQRCNLRDFCRNHRRSFNGLVERPLEEGIIHSGIVKEENL